MKNLKQFAVVLLGIGLFVGLNVLAGSVAFSRTFKDPETVKQTFSDSNVYEPAATAIVEQGTKNIDPSTDIPLDDPTVQNAIQSAISPEVVQQNAEEIIDSVYAWANGETNIPAFTINTEEIKNQIAENISKAGLARVEKLPVCTPAELQKIDLNNIDPFTISCRPPGVNLNALQEQYEQEIANSDKFLTDPSITAQDVKDESGQNIFAQTDGSPTGSQQIFSLPVLASIATILCAVGVVFLRPTKRSGLRIVCILAIVSGVLIGLGAFLTSSLFNGLSPNFAEADAAALQESVLSIVRSLSNAINQTLFMFAGVYTLLGAGGLTALHLTRPPKPEEAQTGDSQKEAGTAQQPDIK